MERIRALTRLVLMIALITLVCTWISPWYAKEDTNKKAYEQWDAYMQTIHKEINQNEEYTSFMSEEEFAQDLSKEALSDKISQWLEGEMKGHAYSQETQEEIKQELTGLYQSQKTMAEDPVYFRYVWITRGAAATILVLSLAIIGLLKKKERLLKTREVTYKDSYL